MIADIVPYDITSLAIVLLAIVPGYLAVTIWGRRKTWKGRSTDLSTIVDSITLSAVIQVLALPLTLTMLYPYRKTLDSHEVRVAFWLIIVVLVLPIVGGAGWARLSSLADSASGTLKGSENRLLRWIGRLCLFLVPPSTPPRIWDLVFKARIPDGAFLIVTFDDGYQIAGVFHEVDGRRSYALTSPQPPGLYMAQEYALDAQGNIYALLPNSKGVMIPSIEHVKSVRMLSPGNAGNHEAEQRQQNTGDTGGDQGGGVVDDDGTNRDPAQTPAAAGLVQPTVEQADAGASGAPIEQSEDLNSPELGYS
jgi:hypothetical protein